MNLISYQLASIYTHLSHIQHLDKGPVLLFIKKKKYLCSIIVQDNNNNHPCKAKQNLYWLFPPGEQGLSWMSHHQQTALITPTSLIKDTHLCLCQCVQHMMCIHYKQWAPPTHTLTLTWVRTSFYITPSVNCSASWNKVRFNIVKWFLFGFSTCNPPGRHIHSLCGHALSINLRKLNTCFQ